MICIKCGHSKTSVTNSRPQDQNMRTWRRRRCLACRSTFTTNEIADDTEIAVTKTQGSTEPFEIGKLTTSIYSSFIHNNELGSTSSYWLSMSVKYTLMSSYLSKQKDITPEIISMTAHEALKRFDHIASVQYAARHGLIKK